MSIRGLLSEDRSKLLKDVVVNNIHVVQSGQSMFDALAIMQKFHLLVVILQAQLSKIFLYHP